MARNCEFPPPNELACYGFREAMDHGQGLGRKNLAERLNDEIVRWEFQSRTR